MVWRKWLFFGLGLLIELDYVMKGYAGGLVSFRRTDLSHVGHVGVSSVPMIVVSASLFVGFRFPRGNEARQTDDVTHLVL